MALFFQIMLAVFLAEMGDKTQLMMIAMTARYRVRDIIIGAGAAILALNALAVGAGALVSSVIPPWLIKLTAALAFFYFAWSTLRGEDADEEKESRRKNQPPILAVFGSFFLAELGDKTQLTAITFAASAGVSKAVLVWAACSVGLFAADVIGMLLGYLLKSKAPEGIANTLAFVIFALFGVLTLRDGLGLLLEGGAVGAVTAAAALLFALVCILTLKHREQN